MYARVKDLPDCIQTALRAVSYGRPDISIEASERVSPMDPGSDGRRGFCMIVELATGRTEHHQGSWGGANMFNPQNRVDLDRNTYQIHEGVAVISGSTGYKGTYATVALNAANMALLLPPAPEVTEREQDILTASVAHKRRAEGSLAAPPQVPSF